MSELEPTDQEQERLTIVEQKVAAIEVRDKQQQTAIVGLVVVMSLFLVASDRIEKFSETAAKFSDAIGVIGASAVAFKALSRAESE